MVTVKTAGELQKLQREVAHWRNLFHRVYLTAKEVRARYNVSRTSYYRKLKPLLPPPRSFPQGVWLLSDLVRLEEAGQLPDPAS